MFLKVLNGFLFVLFIIMYFLISPLFVMTFSVISGSFLLAHKYWSDLGCKILNVRFDRVPESSEVSQQNKTMLLLNHRSWSDFFIHDVVTDYTANFVSRMAVGIIFPTILLLSHLTRSIWFFKRGNKGSLESLFTWFGLKWRQAYRKNVIVYPEGHRMYGAEKPSYLKKGMIGYAFRNKVDCQIIITFGNDKVCDEKSLKLRANQTVYSYTTDVIKPQNFSSEVEFYEHIQKQFADGFELVKNYMKENQRDENIQQQQQKEAVKTK